MLISPTSSHTSLLSQPVWRRRHTAIALVLALSALCWAAPASAQDSGTQLAKQYFDDGQNLYVQGKFLEAAQKFQQAYDAKPFPAFLFNTAVCHEKNRDFQKALKQYEAFLAADPHTRDRKLVEKRIAAIRAYLSPPPPPSETQPSSQPAKEPVLPKLPPVQTKGLVVVESNPEGAAIYLQDKSKGIFTRTPFTGTLPPGQHTLILELKEFKPIRKTIFVRHDRLTYLYFALSRQRTLGWIEVKGNIPSANVYFDKRSFGAVGRTPYSGYLRPGKRRIIIERPGYEPFVRELTVIAGKTHVVDFNMTKVRHGWVKVTGHTTQGATIKLDGKPSKCESYPCRPEVMPGEHVVRVEREGFKPYETKINVARTEEVQVAVRLNPKPSRIKAYVSFGMAALLLGGGIAAGVISNNRKSSLEDDLENNVIFDSDDNRLTEGKVAAIVANSLFALSGVAATLGIYYLFRKVGPESYGETRSRKISLAPIVGPEIAGLSSQVRF